MKFMGSKRTMLQNGLGEILRRDALGADRFVDLFAGTAAVSWHVAQHTDLRVLACDLQNFSAVLSNAVLRRTHPLALSDVDTEWLAPSQRAWKASAPYQRALRLPLAPLTGHGVLAAREMCADNRGGAIWRAYGGHYFSPLQAAGIDALLRRIPSAEPMRSTCHAALILAASRCAASPGHTAQPFQPTTSALPYIETAWAKDPFEKCRQAAASLVDRHANTIGEAVTGDANALASEVQEGDLVFVDPPYSSVHYSRFYHVLETIARGGCGTISGTGRYPPTSERPSSAYSVKTQARHALVDLLETLRGRKCRIVLTFPQSGASNGLDGEGLVDLARTWFYVDAHVVSSRFSTLGGNNGNRSARRRTGELIMSMSPKGR